MIRHAPALLLAAAMALGGCAGLGATAPGGTTLALAGTDDRAAAARLVEFMLARGWPAEPASDDQSLFVYRRGVSTLLSPVLRARGLDRLIATRSYAPGPGRDAEDLRRLAAALNARLNVGSFAVADGALLFESHLTFVDTLGLAELEAFLAWMTDVEQAIASVDGDARTLLLTGGGDIEARGQPD